MNSNVRTTLLNSLSITRRSALRTRLPTGRFLSRQEDLFKGILLGTTIATTMTLRALFVNYNNLLSHSMRRKVITITTRLMRLLTKSSVRPIIPSSVTTLIVIKLSIIDNSTSRRLRAFRLIMVFPFNRTIRRGTSGLLAINRISIDSLTLATKRHSNISMMTLYRMTTNYNNRLAIGIGRLRTRGLQFALSGSSVGGWGKNTENL